MTARQHRRYGDTYIDGNATAHLGDKLTTNNIRIESVYFALQNELGLPSIKTRKRPLQRALLRDPNQRQLKRVAVQELSERPAKKKCQKSSNCVEDLASGSVSNRNGLGELRRPPGWLPNVSQLLLKPIMANRTSLQHDTCELSKDTSFNNNTSDALQITGPDRDLLLVGTTIISCVLGCNLLPTDAAAVVRRWSQDKPASLLLMVLLFGFYRFLLTSRISINPCPLDTHSITLEDAYGRLRPVSIDICRSFSILSSFLDMHYEETSGTTAGALVRAGRFHLMLESRYGMVVDSRHWLMQHFRPGSRIVNSVYVDREAALCLSCSTPLDVSAFGDFLWYVSSANWTSFADFVE